MRFENGHIPPNFKDMSGQRIGMLTVVRQAESRPGQRGGKAYWLCRCDCGKQSEVDGYSLRYLRYSCGCGKATTATHGRSGTRTYRTWTGMIQRCTNPNVAAYVNYGGRGIAVCKRWMTFENFFKDMGDCPVGHSIERRDNARGYSPRNCCWLPTEKQAQNRRGNVYVELDGERLCVEDAARRLGIKGPTVRYRATKSVSKRDIGAPVSPGNTKLITFNGETLSMKKWAERLGIGRAALSMRLGQYGWSIERALGTKEKEAVS